MKKKLVVLMMALVSLSAFSQDVCEGYTKEIYSAQIGQYNCKSTQRITAWSEDSIVKIIITLYGGDSTLYVGLTIFAYGNHIQPRGGSIAYFAFKDESYLKLSCSHNMSSSGTMNVFFPHKLAKELGKDPINRIMIGVNGSSKHVKLDDKSVDVFFETVKCILKSEKKK